MHPHTPPLLASRFVGLDDGLSLDLATGDRVWIERRVLDDEARVVWPEMTARLWRLWHPALAQLVDFGFQTAREWFEAYAVSATGVGPDRAGVEGSSAFAFLRAHEIVCDLTQARLPHRSIGLVPGLPTTRGGPVPPAGPGLGMRLLPRALEAHVATALDDRRARGPRLWSVDATEGSGWRTTRRRLAREARLRGYVPIAATVLEAAVRRQDGHQSSWLSLLDGMALVVFHERVEWHLQDRQGLARLLVRLGGAESAGTVVLDVLRRCRPCPAAHALGALTVEDLATALWVSPGCCSPHWLRARALAESAGGLPGVFVGHVASRLGIRTDVPSVHERPPDFAVDRASGLPATVDTVGILQRARALVVAGRAASAQRHVRRAAWACVRRRADAAAAGLLVESARIAALRGDVAQSRECWREASRLVPSTEMAVFLDGAAEVAEQWIRQAALADAECLLGATTLAARVLDRRPPARVTGLLATCLCWQARWADALRLAVSEPSAGDAPSTSRVWAHLERRDAAAALADLRAAKNVTPREAAIAQLRIEVATGGVPALLAATQPGAGAGRHPLSLVDDDEILLPAEGLVRHRVALPGPVDRRLRTLARRDLPRLVRARARLVLALASARATDVATLEHDVARVARGTSAVALEAGRAVVSAWPARPDEENPIMLDHLVAVLRACQAHDDPRAALSAVCHLLQARLVASAVMVAGANAQGTSVLSRPGPPDLAALAGRAIDVGQPIVTCEPGATDCAVPVRLGDAVVGALACRWAMPEAQLDPSLRALIEAAAVAVAPTVRLGVEMATRPVVGLEPSSLLGASTAIAAVRAAVEAASRVPFTVLVEGESGSGKELVAREIHRLGPRRQRSFCAVNCAALTDDLCEAELFGHARGAFTGAVGERAGLFEEADGGTLFLDEVSELSPRAQAKLLRAIQEGEIRRLGETRSRRVDARVIAATNRPLADAVAAGAFRADLRYRLDVIHITMPPLRDRPDDVPLLARHFWERATERVGSHARLTPETLAALARYDWPGNVRELQNALAALSVYAPRHGVVRATALPAAITHAAPLGGVTLHQARRLVDERLVRAALAQTGGHRGRAATALGVTRQGLAKLVDRLHLERGAEGAAPAS